MRIKPVLPRWDAIPCRLSMALSRSMESTTSVLLTDPKLEISLSDADDKATAVPCVPEGRNPPDRLPEWTRDWALSLLRPKTAPMPSLASATVILVIRNRRVIGSSPIIGSILTRFRLGAWCPRPDLLSHYCAENCEQL